MNIFKTAPATLILIGLNILFFTIAYLQIGTLHEPDWWWGLLEMGALFNPYTLDGEWHRIFVSMFLHGNLLHLAVNMVALFMVGSRTESITGTTKFIVVYFISGIGAALATLYISVLTVGVGASGAIFGIFGFTLWVNIRQSREQNLSLTPLFISFGIFLGINLVMAPLVRADNAAHLGGLITGLLIGLFAFVTKESYSKIKLEVLLVPAFIILFLLLPRYQVAYNKFFQKLLDVEDQIRNRASEKHTDSEFIEIYKQNYAAWDSTLHLLDTIPYFPEKLHEDTARVRAYVKLLNKEFAFRIIMLEKESFIYLDSIELVQYDLRMLPRPKYFPPRKPRAEQVEPPPSGKPKGDPVKVLYDSNWVEIPNPPCVYYRIGFKDSLGNWDGNVTDYYNTGDVQMKGTYQSGKRDGVFIYYSDHKTYSSAGRYREDMSYGKWETFHRNGKLASEVYYRNEYFMKNLWDSTGILLVNNGNGTELYHFPNGVISEAGQYVNGHKEGYWYGRYENGKLYYEENFFRGRLVNGRSFGKNGELFYYDESSFFPIPEGGFPKLRTYLSEEAAKDTSGKEGIVRLSFRVTVTGQLTDIQVVKSTVPELNTKAKEILLNGPRWLPGKNHGQKPEESYSFIEVTFDRRL